MAVSQITITDLEAVGVANQINLQWAVDDPHFNGLPYLQFDHAEVRYSATIGMESPTTLTEDAQFGFNHLQVLPGAAYYYQARAVDRSGQFGEWCDPVLGEEQGIDSSAISTPWDDFTPSVASTGGTLGGVSLGTCRYKQVGLMVFFTIAFTITSAGSGTGVIRVTLTDLLEAEAFFGAGAVYDATTALSAVLFDNGVANALDLMTVAGASAISAVVNKVVVASGFYEISV